MAKLLALSKPKHVGHSGGDRLGRHPALTSSKGICIPRIDHNRRTTICGYANYGLTIQDRCRMLADFRKKGSSGRNYTKLLCIFGNSFSLLFQRLLSRFRHN